MKTRWLHWAPFVIVTGTASCTWEESVTGLPVRGPSRPQWSPVTPGPLVSLSQLVDWAYSRLPRRGALAATTSTAGDSVTTNLSTLLIYQGPRQFLFLVPGVGRDHLKFTFEARDLERNTPALLYPLKKDPPTESDRHSPSPCRGLLHYMPAVLDLDYAAEDHYSLRQTSDSIYP